MEFEWTGLRHEAVGGHLAGRSLFDRVIGPADFYCWKWPLFLPYRFVARVNI